VSPEVDGAESAGSAPIRVLLDESVPHDLVEHLRDFAATTVQALGWAGMKNGALLRAAREAGFAVLVTVDRRMEYQQDIARSGLALVVLRARTTRVVDLLPLIPSLRAALRQARSGAVTHVGD
jgi:hypothetical protein